MGQIVNIKDKKFGRLTVIERCDVRDKWGKALWKCRCDCGNEVIKTKSDLDSKVKSCGCLRHEVSKKYHWAGYGEISKTYWSSLQEAAASRDIDFDLTMKSAWGKYLKQEKKCALTGLSIEFSNNIKKYRATYKEQTASLDRIDPSKGYVKNNIQWVHKKVNWCKHVLSNTEFIELCTMVADTARV